MSRHTCHVTWVTHVTWRGTHESQKTSLMAHIFTGCTTLSARASMRHGTHIYEYIYILILSHLFGGTSFELLRDESYVSHISRHKPHTSLRRYHPWHTYDWVMAHIWMSHGTRMNEFEWRMNESHTNESWHTYEWVSSHRRNGVMAHDSMMVWMSRKSHMNESCLLCIFLQCVTVCHSVLQCTWLGLQGLCRSTYNNSYCFPRPPCCSVFQCVSVYYSVLQCVAVRFSAFQCIAVCCSVLQCVAVCCSV